jgi:probable F420-dependent oxidoreductase
LLPVAILFPGTILLPVAILFPIGFAGMLAPGLPRLGEPTMKIYTTAPLDDPRDARKVFPELEDIGYDGGFSFEAKHDPFLPLAVAAEHTERLRLGTAIAIAFARNPMNLANLGYGLQVLTGGRFLLGLGSQVRPHIEKRFSSTWSKPAARMREIALAIRAIWDRWEGKGELDFRGEFYKHTLMIPAFDPGPNPYGPPPIFTAGYGPRMTQVAGEVADGFLAHPYNTRESLLQLTVPALRRGLEISGRKPEELEVICVAIVATADSEEDFVRVREGVRKQLAFYGSTPAYRPVLDCHGWGDLHPRFNRLSKEGRWDEMASLVSDEMLETIAVVGERHEIAAKLIERMRGIADGVSLTCNRAPDPGHWRREVADFRRLVEAGEADRQS